MATTVTLKSWIDYLMGRVGIDLYVWGANGETLIILLPKIYDMEKVKSDVARVLKLLDKRLLQKIDVYIIRCCDCSGLSIRFLLEHKIIKSDMTANGLYEYIVGNKEKGIKAHGKKIALKDVQAGDYLFMGSDTNKWHVGYAVSKTAAVESKNHDEGVVQTSISERGWKYAARPDWYSDQPTPPEPEKPVLKRELYFAKDENGKIIIRGEDVKQAQILLTDKGYNPGEVDGIFGNNTMIATKNFQHDNKLTEDGVIGKVTATMLGFKWEG